MEKIMIHGQRPLRGEVEINGSKNAAVAILPAALLANDVVILENVPDIADIKNLIQIMREMEVKVDRIDSHTLRIDSRHMINDCANSESVRKMRASYYLLGVLLGRFKHARVAFPGGCDFGVRPIDLHVKGFEALGAEVNAKAIIEMKARELVGTNIFLDFASVGATINIMLAACLAEGQTILENAAKEPHVVDVANFLMEELRYEKREIAKVVLLISKLTPKEVCLIPTKYYQIQLSTHYLQCYKQITQY